MDQSDDKPDACAIPNAGIGRREFLQRAGAGAIAVGSVAGSWAATTEAPSARKKTPSVDYDVIVIGGGFAGVTAARNVRRSGGRVLLLEARDRLGGRTLTSDLAGHQVELGGTWIHWTQPFVWAEKERYALDVVETPAKSPVNEEFIVKIGEDRVVLVGEDVNPIVAAVEDYFAEARQVWDRPYDAAFTWPEIISRDGLSAVDALDRKQYSPLQRAVVASYLAGLGNCDPRNLSYVDMLRWWSLPGWNFGALNDSVIRYKFKDGTIALINAIVADGKPEVRLSTPVRRIDDLDGRVVVTTSRGEKISAAAVIVTLPLNVLPDVEFSPSLDAKVAEAGKEGHCGAGIKVMVKTKGRVTQHDKSTALGSVSEPLSFVFTYALEDDYSILCGFGPTAGKLDVNNVAAVQAALRTYYPNIEVDACVGHAWTTDPYSRGTWANYRPGWFEKYYAHFGKERGRVLFASADYGEGWRGFIDGAIGSGIRAAQRVETILG